MLITAKENVHKCFRTILDTDVSLFHEVEEAENALDQMNKEISQYISKILIYDKSGESVAAIEEYFLITGNAERIGDHALNIAGYIKMIERKQITFSEEAREEIRKMQTITESVMEHIMKKEDDMPKWLSRAAAMEQQIDDMTVKYREKHLERMRRGLCTEEACILYSELLTDFERIGDHALNIAQAYAKISVNI